QTEEYIRGLLREYGSLPADRIEFWVRARLARQVLLKKNPKTVCVFFVHENAVRMTVGNAGIMQDQLLHLIFVASLPHCEVRFIPRCAGPLGTALGPFRLMRYVEHDPVVEIDLETNSLFLDHDQDTDHYQRVLDRLDNVALGEG